MNLTLHHVSLATDRVEDMDDFYRRVVLLDRERNWLPVLGKGTGLCW